MRNNWKKGISQGLGLAAICLIPILLMFIILQTAEYDLQNYHFLISDETDYWIESLSIAKHGLVNPVGGYFGFGFNNHAPLLNYGGHGFFNLFPTILTVAFFTQAQYSALITNTWMTVLGILGYYAISRSLKNTLIVTAAHALFVPFLIYFFTGMIEIIIFTAVFFLLPLWQKIEKGDRPQTALFWYCVIVFIWSLFRITFIFFFIPTFFYELWRLKKPLWGLIAKYGLLCLAVAVLFWLTSTSYPWYFSSQWLRSTNKVEYFIRHGLSSAFHFVWPVGVDPLEVALRHVYLLWTLISAVDLFKSWKKLSQVQRLTPLSNVLVLVANLAFLVLMYDIEGFRTVRYLGAILSFSVLLRVTSDDQSLSPLKRWLAPGMVWGILIIALLTQAPRVYNDVITRRLEPKQLSSALGWIEYDPHAKDRWGNTVYLDLFDDTSIDFNYYSVGLGLMYMNLDEMDDALALAPASEALKARYLLTSQDVEIPGYIRVKSDDGMNLFLKSE